MTEERQKLVTDNMRLALYLANKYKSIPYEFEEIISAAYLGLVKAANTFNLEKGTTFATYARTCITNEILIYARQQKKQSIAKVSLDEPVPDTEDITLQDMIPACCDGFDACERRIDFQRSIKDLSKRELQIVTIKVLNPDKSQKQIEKETGLSQSYVSRVIRSAKRKMMGEVA